MFELTGGLSVDKSLEIGAASGDENGDTGFIAQHRTTFSSPATISPMR